MTSPVPTKLSRNVDPWTSPVILVDYKLRENGRRSRADEKLLHIAANKWLMLPYDILQQFLVKKEEGSLFLWK